LSLEIILLFDSERLQIKFLRFSFVDQLLRETTRCLVRCSVTTFCRGRRDFARVYARRRNKTGVSSNNSYY